MSKELWLVGQSKETTWEFQGVFNSLKGALDACIDDLYFIAPVLLNEKLSHETTDFPCLCYPLRGGEIKSWNEKVDEHSKIEDCPVCGGAKSRFRVKNPNQLGPYSGPVLPDSYQLCTICGLQFKYWNFVKQNLKEDEARKESNA